MIPILRNHDSKNTIGVVEVESTGALRVRFSADVEITREAFFEIFGNCGVAFDDYELKGDILIVRAGRILEFSLNR